MSAEPGELLNPVCWTRRTARATPSAALSTSLVLLPELQNSNLNPEDLNHEPRTLHPKALTLSPEVLNLKPQTLHQAYRKGNAFRRAVDLSRRLFPREVPYTLNPLPTPLTLLPTPSTLTPTPSTPLPTPSTNSHYLSLPRSFSLTLTLSSLSLRHTHTHTHRWCS
jgi:hypothetical protein